VEGAVLRGFCLLAVLLECLAVLLEVLDELVLAAELLVVAEVVDTLMREQSLLVELGDELLLAPDHVPLLALHALPPSPLEGLQNAVSEIGAEADVGTACGRGYM
jgi:hypothetical protein